MNEDWKCKIIESICLVSASFFVLVTGVLLAPTITEISKTASILYNISIIPTSVYFSIQLINKWMDDKNE